MSNVQANLRIKSDMAVGFHIGARQTTKVPRTYEALLKQ